MNNVSDSSDGSEDDTQKAAPSVQEARHAKLLREVLRFGGGAIVSAVATGFAANYFGNGCTNSSYMPNLLLIFIVSFALWLGVFGLFKNTVSPMNPAPMLLGVLLVTLVMFPCIPIMGFWIAPVCN